ARKTQSPPEKVPAGRLLNLNFPRWVTPSSERRGCSPHLQLPAHGIGRERVRGATENRVHRAATVRPSGAVPGSGPVGLIDRETLRDQLDGRAHVFDTRTRAEFTGEDARNRAAAAICQERGACRTPISS